MGDRYETDAAHLAEHIDAAATRTGPGLIRRT
jgi:hypothetical protein